MDSYYTKDTSELDRYDHGKHTTKLEDKIGTMQEVLFRKGFLINIKNLKIPLFKKSRLYKMTSFDIVHIGEKNEPKYQLIVYGIPLHYKKK